MATRNYDAKAGGADSGGFAASPSKHDEKPQAVFVEVIRSIWINNERIDPGSNPVALPTDIAERHVKAGTVRYV